MATSEAKKIDRPLAMPSTRAQFSDERLPPSLATLYTQIEAILQAQARTADKLDDVVRFMHENARTGARVGKLEDVMQHHAQQLTELRTKAAIWGVAVSTVIVVLNTAASIIIVSLFT